MWQQKKVQKMLYEEIKSVVQLIELVENYGPFKSRRPYKLVDEESDWLLLKCRGNQYFVPKMYEDKKKKYSHEPLPTYEEIIGETTEEWIDDGV